MTASSRRVFVVVGLLLCSVVVGSGLLALEARSAPFPTPDDTRTYEEALDELASSTLRWQRVYLPLLQLGISIGVGVLIAGRMVWLENLGASVFVLALVFVHHATTSLWSAAIFVLLYLVVGALAATVVRSRSPRVRRSKG